MIKAHGTGNTFYIVDEPIEDFAAFTIEHCKDGTDGVLFVCDSKEHIAKMRIFNSDGSEPEMCGNGLRVFGRYILEKHNLKEATIETLNQAYHVSYINDFYGMVGISITLTPVIHKAHKSADHLSSQSQYEFEFYTVSNPHVAGVIEERINRDNLNEIGLLGNKLFDEGINVNMIQILEPGKIYVQTYERGVGITKSCGTGMTSSSVHYARHFNYFNQPIEIYNDGGMILCEVKKDDNYTVQFTGNATFMEHDTVDCKADQEKYIRFFESTR